MSLSRKIMSIRIDTHGMGKLEADTYRAGCLVSLRVAAELAAEHECDAAILYQVLGTLLSDAGRFNTDEGEAVLDLASYLAGTRERPTTADSIIPFDSKPYAAEHEALTDQLASLVDRAPDERPHTEGVRSPLPEP